MIDGAKAHKRKVKIKYVEALNLYMVQPMNNKFPDLHFVWLKETT